MFRFNLTRYIFHPNTIISFRCHGEKDNIVFELAEPLGLLGRPDPHDSWYVLSNGDLAPDATCKEILANLDEEVCKSQKNNVQSISQFVRNA